MKINEMPRYRELGKYGEMGKESYKDNDEDIDELKKFLEDFDNENDEYYNQTSDQLSKLGDVKEFDDSMDDEALDTDLANFQETLEELFGSNNNRGRRR